MDIKKVAVFGASGFVGRHVVRHLAAGGTSVVAIARNGTRLTGANVVGVSLDVSTAGAQELAGALDDCNAVVNLVGIKRETRKQTFHGLHVRFVENLLAAMKSRGVGRLIHVSVVSARADRKSAYHDTKWQAEERILGSSARHTILRPGVIYGAGDDLLGHLTKMIRASPVFPIVGDGLTEQQPIDVADVARAVSASLRTPAAVGKTYEIVGPAPLTLRAIIATVARALDLDVRIVNTPIAIMRPAVRIMNAAMHNPLSTPAQLQMLVDGMTGAPGPMQRELGVDPAPFTVDRIRSLARASASRLPFDLRLDAKTDGPASGGLRLALLAALGVAVMNGAFLLRGADTWTRLVSAIAFLGAFGLRDVWRDRRTLLRPDRPSVALGITSGLALYGAARLATILPAVATEAAKVSGWSGGHSMALLVPTLTLAVVGEELFWRGAITRMLAARGPRWIGALVATALFSLAHVGSGTWLLFVGGAGIVATWNLLFVTTGTLVALLVSHLVFDALAMLIAPLG